MLNDTCIRSTYNNTIRVRFTNISVMKWRSVLFGLPDLFSSCYSKLPTAQVALKENVNDCYVDRSNAGAWDSKRLPITYFNYKQDLTNNRFKISMNSIHEILEVLKSPILNIGNIFNAEWAKFRLKLSLKNNITKIATWTYCWRIASATNIN